MASLGIGPMTMPCCYIGGARRRRPGAGTPARARMVRADMTASSTQRRPGAPGSPELLRSAAARAAKIDASAAIRTAHRAAFVMPGRRPARPFVAPYARARKVG